MKYTPYIPQDAPLAGEVELLFALDGYLPEHKRERIVPNGRMTLVIELDDRPRYIYDEGSDTPRQTCQHAWLSGIQSGYMTIGDLDFESNMVVAQFAPCGSTAFTHRPASDVCNAVLPADVAFDSSILDLRARLFAMDDPRDKLDALSAWLTGRYDPNHAAPAHIADACARIASSPGDARVTEIVEEEAGVSHKHFIDQFRKHVGVTPKRMQRILRFAQIFEALQGTAQINWSEVSRELGYSDQAHLIREFHAFSGYRPTTFQAEEHDRLNFFPDDQSDSH